MAGNFDGIKQRRFGVEIEMTGITRCAAAKAIQKVLGGSIDHEGGTYDKYTVGDEKGRRWQIVYDSSIYARKKNGDSASDYYKVEMTVQVKNKERFVGDALSADDFIVTVKNNDGSTEINPAGWQFTPLKLTNTENVIAIVYKQLISYVRVEALPAGSFWCVQVPAKNLDDALRMQKELTLAGYSNPAVIEL